MNRVLNLKKRVKKSRSKKVIQGKGWWNGDLEWRFKFNKKDYWCIHNYVCIFFSISHSKTQQYYYCGRF